MFKLVLEKAEEPEIRLPTSAGSSKKQESSRKTSISALLTMPKPLTVWITINCGQFWKRREYQTTWPASWETYMQVRKQQLELDMVGSPCCPRDSQEYTPTPQFENISSSLLNLLSSPTLTSIHNYWKNHCFVSLLSNTLSRFVIAFFPRSKRLLISWL